MSDYTEKKPLEEVPKGWGPYVSLEGAWAEAAAGKPKKGTIEGPSVEKPYTEKKPLLSKDYIPYSYAADTYAAMTDHDIPDEIFERMKKIEKGIVPDGKTPNEETYRIVLDIVGDASYDQPGYVSDVFTLYSNMRYKQLTSENVGPAEKAKLFEEFLTVVSMVKEKLKENSYGATDYDKLRQVLSRKANISRDGKTSITLTSAIADLYENREQYHLPEYVHDIAHRSENGKKSTFFRAKFQQGGILNPTRTPGSCPIMPVTTIMESLFKGEHECSFRIPQEDVRAAWHEVGEGGLDKKFAEQKKEIAEKQAYFEQHGSYPSRQGIDEISN